MPRAGRFSVLPPCAQSALAPLSVRPLPGLYTIQWISLCASERDDGTEEDPNGIRPGRLDGLLRDFEHEPGEDPEFLGEGVRVALRVRAVPDGRVPFDPDARRWARRNPTGAGEGDPGEHELRARRRPRCRAKEGRAGGWADRPAARGRPGHGELLLVPPARWPDPRGMARCPRVADGA